MENSFNTIQKVRLEEIRPSEHNKTVYNASHEDRIIKLANNIKRNGQLEPLIVSSDMVIISGHTRYLAMKYLGRTFVNIRVHSITSDHPDFIKLLVAANDQRRKTQEELMKEIEANWSPLEYKNRYLSASLFDKDVSLEEVKGSLKASRHLTGNYEELQKNILDVLQELEDYLPTTVRSLHYQLCPSSRPKFKPSKASDDFYDNTNEYYSMTSRILTNMRINGIVDHNCIRDDNRPLNTNRGFMDSRAYMENELENLFYDYDRDLLQSQKFYFCLICEKETLAPVIKRIEYDYGIPVAYIKGESSVTVRYNLLKDWQRNGEKPIVLFMLTDLDPAGYRIQDTFVGSLKKDFKRMLGNTPIKAYRIGITKEQVELYNLPSNLDAKKTDNNYKDFLKRTRLTSAYELDSLKPDVLINEIKKALDKVIDLEQMKKEVEIFNEELRHLEAKRRQILIAI